MSTTRHRLDTASQSSDEFLQQFPAPPVPQHFSDMNNAIIDNRGTSHPLNEKAYHPEPNTPTLNNSPMADNAYVQKPNDHSHHGTNAMPTTAAAATTTTTQRQPSIPNAYALNTDFKFVDRPEKKVHWTKRNCFFRWICCSMCFPPWVAYIVWFIVIAVIICIIVIGALLGSFKMPTINFAGLNSTLPSGTQQIEFSSTGVVIHAGLILNVLNPNVLSMKLSNLTAKAYYPINGTMVQIGKGYLDHQFIPEKSDINFTYPFQIDYNPSDPNSKYLLSSISDKCGFTGNAPSDIDISYDVSLNAQVLFVHVSPTISSSASFACPFEKGQIPGLSSTGSSGQQGGLDGILGGLGAQVNESSSTTTAHPTARATALSSSSVSTTTVRSTTMFSSSASTILPSSTSQFTHISAVPTAALSATSAIHPSITLLSHTVASHSTMSSLSTTLVAPTTSHALPSTSLAAAVPPSSVQPRMMSSLTTSQPASSSRTTSVMHASSNLASSTIARPTTTTARSSTSHPTPTPEDDGDDDQDDGDDDNTDEDDGDDDGDDDDGDDDDDDEQ